MNTGVRYRVRAANAFCFVVVLCQHSGQCPDHFHER